MIRINFNPGNQSVPWIAAMPYAHRAWSATLAFAVMAGTPGLAHSAVKPAPAAHEPSSQPLAEVVVVGNRSQRMQVPGAADRLERADLEGAHVLSVNEALRKVPGVYARDEEGLGLRPNIGLRGLNPTRSAKILLLEDGLPLAYAPYGDNATYYHPPIERFERIGHTGRQGGLRVREGCDVIALMRNATDTAQQRRQCLRGISCNLSSPRHVVGGRIHRQHRRTDIIAHTLHGGRDALGSLCAFHGQRADFVGYHGEAQPFIPGPRGFDGRVEGQQIRLSRDA